MTGTDSIQVETLHEQNILYHALYRNGLAVNGMSVVAVGSLEHHALVVDKYLAVAILNLTESVFLC